MVGNPSISGYSQTDYVRSSHQVHNNFANYLEEEGRESYKCIKSNFRNYQDSVAKDEYCKLGQNNRGRCNTDTNDFVNFEDDSIQNKFRHTGDLNFKNKPYNDMLDEDLKNVQMSRLKALGYNNDFPNQTFIIRSKHKDKSNPDFTENLSMNNLLNDSFDNQPKKGSPESVNSMYGQRSRNFYDNNLDRQKM